jgi:glycerophosphoryl diester phosphodiesterase
MSATASAQPLIIGHRGSSAAAPENTIAAFTRAFRDGADGIEFDIRLARDGVPVVIHDATLMRTAQIPGSVSDFTGSELGRIDVGSWFNRHYPTAARGEYQQETIPSLVQLFESFVLIGCVR